MVTGGTSGIGFAIAERFLQEGAEKVVLVGRSYPRLEEAAIRLQEAVLKSGATASASASASGGAGGAGDDKTTQSTEGDASQQGLDAQLNEDVLPSTVATSDRIGLLVGDVADAGSWMRELENELVRVILTWK